MFSRIQLFIVAGLILASFSINAQAQSVEAPAVQEHVLSYHLDLALVYYDKFKNPLARSQSMTSLDVDRSNQFASLGNRSLGLGWFKVDLDWGLARFSRLRVGLRPDSVNHDVGSGEFDSRVGSVYFQRPKVNFIDTYELDLLFGSNLTLKFGVFDDLAENGVVFQSPLQFGLQTEFSQRFAAIAIDWAQTQPAFALPSPQVSDAGWHTNFFAFQGNEDRVEQRRFQESTQDLGPESDDAHQGLAARVFYMSQKGNRLGLMVGMSKNDYSEPVEDDPGKFERKGKREEIFAQIFQRYRFPFKILPLGLSIDYRLLKEKWKSDRVSFSPRLHQSFYIASNLGLTSTTSMLVGFHYGKSEIKEGVITDGYQLDLGGSCEVRPNLSFGAYFAEEHRESESEGERIGAFLIDGKEAAIVRRFALEVRYLL